MPKKKTNTDDFIPYTTVSGIFSRRRWKDKETGEIKYGKQSKAYTFLCRIRVAETLKKGDLAMVKLIDECGMPQYSFIKIQEVHAESNEIPGMEYRWVFQRVDTEEIKLLEESQKNGAIQAVWLDDIPF